MEVAATAPALIEESGSGKGPTRQPQQQQRACVGAAPASPTPRPLGPSFPTPASQQRRNKKQKACKRSTQGFLMSLCITSECDDATLSGGGPTTTPTEKPTAQQPCPVAAPSVQRGRNEAPHPICWCGQRLSEANFYSSVCAPTTSTMLWSQHFKPNLKTVDATLCITDGKHPRQTLQSPSWPRVLSLPPMRSCQTLTCQSRK